MGYLEELFSLEGKVALVTGAASGLGQRFAVSLAKAGADVVISDVDSKGLDTTFAMIKETKKRALKVIGDVSNRNEVKNMVDSTISNLGRLDVAINNAGVVTRPISFHEMSLEDWDRVISINLTGVFLCMQREIEVMIRQGSGSIINISSVLGLVGLEPELKPRVNYIASKHGVNGLTRQAAIEYARYGIRVNAVAPSWFQGTSLSKARLSIQSERERELRDRLVMETTPLRRMGDMKELEGIIIFLASDASSYVTGQIFVVDGGWTAK